MIRSSAPRARRFHPARSFAAIAVAAGLVPVLAGCAAGLNAQTNQPFATTDGASAVFQNIAIRNVFVLGPAVGTTLRPGQSASLFLALVNNGSPDRLTGVFAPGTAASVTIRGGAVNLGQGQAALLTGPSPRLILDRLSKPLTGGTSIRLILYFQNAGAVALNVPVVPWAQYYATFSPPPSPVAATATAKRPRAVRSGGAGGTPSPSVSTGSPSPSASP